MIAAGFYRFIKVRRCVCPLAQQFRPDVPASQFLEYETVLGPEPDEHCNHPVLQITTTHTGSVDNLPATSGEIVEPKQGYAIEGATLLYMDSLLHHC